MLNNEELAWLAGFYEGEGSVGCYKRIQRNPKGISESYSFRVLISQNEDTPLLWARNQLDLGTVTLRTRNGSLGKTPLWVWTIANNEALKFLDLIKPYLRLNKRKEQIQKALNLRKQWRKHGPEISASKAK